MVLKVRIEMDNAAFGEDAVERAAEVRRILALVADRMERGRDGGALLDSNGNTVGEWDIEEA
jgi:hypothetical protein